MLIMIRDQILLSRPYSWGTIFFICVLGNLVSYGFFNLTSFFMNLAFGWSVWIFVNLFTEFFQKDKPIRKINFYLIFSLFIFIIFLLFFNNPINFILFLFLLISFFLYSLKNKNIFFGQLSFLFRGNLEFLLFIIILVMNNFNFIGDYWVKVAIFIYLITAARNLVGDLRDISKDRLTLPKIQGVLFTKFIVSSLYFLAFFIMGYVLFAIIPFLLILYFKDYLVLHKVLVLLSMFILASLSMIFSLDLIIFWVLLTLPFSCLIKSYDLVPGRSAR